MNLKSFAAVFAAAGLTLALAGTANAVDNEARARELINALGCKGCHQFNGEGGNLGPALDQVGARLTSGQLRAKLVDPKASVPTSIMPSFSHMAEEDLKVLTEYLAGLK
ncbi:c-type cytochrome [Desulfuromonas versatilis]|uniref:C-type cytochrome n=1 Tax=Desulfuromonas versatilis TaxID=2802975 RepID=A0ABN6E1H2_9BACT|nr:c-type cytochrome [Desulfuromonas versatilis]BCR06119.1 c-type cytochrome [Desulfuromonas versatilis]